MPKCVNRVPQLPCSTKLIKVTPFLRNKLLSLGTIEIDSGSCYICSSCKIRMCKSETQLSKSCTSRDLPTPAPVNMEINQQLSSVSTISAPETTPECDSAMQFNVLRELLLDKLNQHILPLLNEELINIRNISSQTYLMEKLNSISSSLKEKIIPNYLPEKNCQIVDEIKKKAKYYDDIIGGLQAKFTRATQKEKQLILTVLPLSWSYKDTRDYFEVSRYFHKNSKDVKLLLGSLSVEQPIPGRNKIPTSTVELIEAFYNNDNNSRIWTGMNDFVTIKKNNEKIQVQKRTLLSTVNEAFAEFKIQYPEIKLGFSTFAQHRPKNCILPGSSGTHSICVCVIHQNVKLIMETAKIPRITNNRLDNYKTCIQKIICSTPTPSCYFLTCESCPGIDFIKKELIESFHNAGYSEIDQISFKIWSSTDRCDIYSLTKSLFDFIDFFCRMLEKLIPHSFITKQQQEFILNRKSTLKRGEFFVVGDFSENYSCSIQDEAQGYYYSKEQVTIHPFVIYYQDEANILQHFSYTMISDCLAHDSVLVNLFIKRLIEYLKTKFPIINRIIYITDGAPTHYKNKHNFINISNHKEDFGIECEWHFHATAHGKGVADGVGGTIKRMARRTSLTRSSDNPINTAEKLYDWAITANTEIDFCFVLKREYDLLKKRLKKDMQKP